jgi:hypothetical protein
LATIAAAYLAAKPVQIFASSSEMYSTYCRIYAVWTR